MSHQRPGNPTEVSETRPSEETAKTKAEVNKELWRQNNFKSAEEVRQTAKAGYEHIRDKKLKHSQEGLKRQQAAMVQMKKASESQEAHRQQNLGLGRKVYEEVLQYKKGAKLQKEQHIVYAKSVKDKIIEANGVGKAKDELSEKKKKEAAATRVDDQAKEAEKEKLKKEREKEVKAAAEVVRKATADEVTDGAKRIFFEQRLKVATDTKSQMVSHEKQKKENHEEFKAKQAQKRQHVFEARGLAQAAKQKLLSERAEAAKSVRSTKTDWSNERRQNMQDFYLERAGKVTSVKHDAIYTEETDGLASPTGSPPRSPKPLTSASPPRSPEPLS